MRANENIDYLALVDDESPAQSSDDRETLEKQMMTIRDVQRALPIEFAQRN